MSATRLHDIVERLANLLRNDARQRGAAFGLQPVHMESLSYLMRCNRYSNTPQGVTEFLGLTKGTVSQTLKLLQEKGLLVKTADKGDKRVVHLTLTRKGERMLAESTPPVFLAKAVQKLKVTQQQQVIDTLRQILLDVQESNKMKSFGVCHTCRFNTRRVKRDSAAMEYFCELTKEVLTDVDVQLICREHKAKGK